MTSSWFRRRGRFTRFCRTDSERATMTSWLCSIVTSLSGTHGFQDNEVLLPTGYDVIVISAPLRLFTIRDEPPTNLIMCEAKRNSTSGMLVPSENPSMAGANFTRTYDVGSHYNCFKTVWYKRYEPTCIDGELHVSTYFGHIATYVDWTSIFRRIENYSSRVVSQ